MASYLGSLLIAYETLGIFLNLPEPQFPSLVKRANQVYLAGLLWGPKVIKHLQQPAPSWSSAHVSSKHILPPALSTTSQSGWVHLLSPRIFCSPVLEHLESLHWCDSELLKMQCPDRQHQLPGELFRMQIPGL